MGRRCRQHRLEGPANPAIKVVDGCLSLSLRPDDPRSEDVRALL